MSDRRDRRGSLRLAPEPSVGLELPAVEAIEAVRTEALPGVALHLAALQAAVAAAQMARPAAAPPSIAPTEPDDYLTTSEAAALLRVSAKWFYRRTKSLPFAKRLSRRELRWSRQGLEAYMARRNA